MTTTPPTSAPLRRLPLPPRAQLALMGHCPLVACGEAVSRGQKIAASRREGLGDVHSPVAGTIARVTTRLIEVAASGGEAVAPESLDGLSGEPLRTKLLALGVDLPPVPAAAPAVLIVNGVDAEPGITARAAVLAAEPGSVARGIAALRAVYAPARVVLAVGPGVSVAIEGVETRVISGTYPAGLDPLVTLAVTGRENPPDALALPLPAVFQAGRVLQTGLPVLETVVSVGTENLVAAVGAPVGWVLAQAGLSFADRDRIVLGGALSGTAAATPAQGVSREADAVQVIHNLGPVAEDAPCVGCGDCIRLCPARVDPAMLSGYAEFGMYDKARAAHIDACFECGLCSWACIARRPVLQYIRLAKSELAARDAACACAQTVEAD